MPADCPRINITYYPQKPCNRLQYSTLRISAQIHQDTPPNDPMRVMIRTNLNQAGRIRRQIIDQVEKNQSYSNDFYDIQATYNTRTSCYEASILLHQVGYYEFKIRVESTRPKNPWVCWADGPNIGVTVTPLPYGRDNPIYCAFIRQFGPGKEQPSLQNQNQDAAIQQLQDQGAIVIPPAGNFKNFISELPFIVHDMGMKIIHLLPINPVPITYGRMGQFGSPYATTDYFGIDHSYATFSQYQTIEDQFIDLTSTIHGLGARVFLDMVINHSGWAAGIHFTHPGWKMVDINGKIVSPGAWGVVWEDLVELDYRHKDLWQYMADVFLCWCRRGIDGFRLDAGYMVPLEVWRYIICKVREEFPNTLFLLEGLGGPWETTEQLLTQGQMNWAYSELFQNYSRQQITDYLSYAQQVSGGKGVLVHYAETHDNDRLAKNGKVYTLMRLHLCAFTSFSGAWGFTNGVEWLATEKINVHRNTALNWGAKENLVREIAAINRTLAENPAFWETDNLVFLDTGDHEVLAFYRISAGGDNAVLCTINLNCESEKTLNLYLQQHGFRQTLRDESHWADLLGQSRVAYDGADHWQTTLQPGQCRLLRVNEAAEPIAPHIPAIHEVDYDKITLIYQILLYRFAAHEVSLLDQEQLLRCISDIRRFIAVTQLNTLKTLREKPLQELLDQITQEQIDACSAVWTLRDNTREFIVPGKKWLVAHSFVPCTAYLDIHDRTERIESIPSPDGFGHFSVFAPQSTYGSGLLRFNWKLQRENMIQRQWQKESYPIHFVPVLESARSQRKIYPIHRTCDELTRHPGKILLTNGRGSVSQCPALPGHLDSKYDSLLSIAPDPQMPQNRLSLLLTMRETISIGRRFFDLDESFLVDLTRFPHPTWQFDYDDGEHFLRLQRSITMPYGKDTLSVRYKVLDASTPVTVSCKSYIEHRWIHDDAVIGDRDAHYRGSVQLLKNQVGFRFSPDEHTQLHLLAREGEYIDQPNWTREVELKEDAQRGVYARGDLFSPGVFNATLRKGQTQIITATAEATAPARITFYQQAEQEQRRHQAMLGRLPEGAAQRDPQVRMLLDALDQFLIWADDRWRLVCGYPWLGQQTRETLRCIPALLAARRDTVAGDLIVTAALTEKTGTLADWLEAPQAGRTQAENPLRWLSALQQWSAHLEEEPVLDRPLPDDRTCRDIALEIWRGLIDPHHPGALQIDPDSGMLYCPPGHTWMDTEAPRVTPRGGYPVEIQALWRQTLIDLAQLLPEIAEAATSLREKLDRQFCELFWDEQRNHLVDCLAAGQYTAAASARPDNAIRFNQLAAIRAGLLDTDKARRIITLTAQRLLIPAGLRSLSEDPLGTPIKLDKPFNHLLSDPHMPYRGNCGGDETQRRLAYHNGTAWVWAYAGFIEAHAIAHNYADDAVRHALCYFEPVFSLMQQSGIGTLPEMRDGNWPHTPRGCFASAAAVAETLRVYLELKYPHSPRPVSNATKKLTVNN